MFLVNKVQAKDLRKISLLNFQNPEVYYHNFLLPFYLQSEMGHKKD